MQTTSRILMIRPVQFAFNPETADSNAFQVKEEDDNVQARAVAEFDELVKVLRANDIEVMVIEDTPVPHTPDSIFPNNWISFHQDGTIVLYPMFATQRRLERKQTVLEAIHDKFQVNQINDLSFFEEESVFLEGTGSMVLDRENKIAYACLSNRTHKTALEAFCKSMNYTSFLFRAVDEKGKAIYHTNVMMCMADKYVVICLDSIPDEHERTRLINKFAETGKEIIPISFDQLNHFAGNMLQVENKAGEKILVMSTQAYRSLSANQLQQLTTYNRIIHSSINTIEKNGGGSARCMIAEIFLSHK